MKREKEGKNYCRMRRESETRNSHGQRIFKFLFRNRFIIFLLLFSVWASTSVFLIFNAGQKDMIFSSSRAKLKEGTTSDHDMKVIGKNKNELINTVQSKEDGYKEKEMHKNTKLDQLWYSPHVDDTNTTALWFGEISKDLSFLSDKNNNSNNKDIKINMVISHCDKPLNWIFEKDFSPTRYKIDEVFVYTKCGNEVIGAPPDATIVELENVGRCDHTYAHHLSSTYESFSKQNSEKIIVLFMKDNPQRSEWWAKRTLDYTIDIAIANGFACIEQEYLFGDKIIPSYYHLNQKWREFAMKDGYVREKDRDKTDLFVSSYTNLGQWVDSLALNRLSPAEQKMRLIPVCYGGVFAVTSHQIVSNEREDYEKIERSLSRGDNIEEGHFCERVWGGLLSKPLSQEATNILIEKKTRVMCRARWKNRCGELAFEKKS